MPSPELNAAIVVRISPPAFLTVMFWLALTHFAHCQTTTPAGPNASKPRREQVVLPAHKLASVGLETQRLAKRRLQPTRVTPGRIRYDDRRHVEVKTAATGIVTKILVKPGDRVAAGDLLAILTSAEVGEKRGELLKLIADRGLAERRLQRSRAIRDGLSKLIYQIEHQSDPRLVLDGVEGIDLGEYRASLLSAYAEWRLAESMQRSGEASAASGALSGRQLEQRRGEYVAARASLQSAVEQAQFDANMALSETENAAADAARQVAVSAQYVAALQGSTIAAPETPTEDLSELKLLAPIAGTIEVQRFAVSERVAPGESLLIVADASQLWVEADIREQEWGALRLEPGQSITVTGSTIGDTPLPAKVHYVGREVSADTNAAAIIATIDNASGALRPGQFVQVRVPVAEPREALAIPESAVVEHEGTKFVFVQESATTFRKVNVRTGVAADGLIEITDGPRDGDILVTRGAFTLKSELLLGELAE